MRYLPFALIACASLGLATAPAKAQEGCTRTSLQLAADSYVAAQRIGDTAGMNLAPGLSYLEHRTNSQLTDIAKGLLGKALKVDFSRSVLDTQNCESFTEVIVADPAHAYVLGTRLKLAGEHVSEIETYVSDADDWLFDAAGTLRYSASEKWDPIPAERQGSRESLIAAANAYLNLFSDPASKVPWGSPCARLEGGLYTGKGVPEDSCNVGVPSGVDIVDRRFVVDRELGTAVALVVFGKNKLPDAHSFRVENGRIRYVHTITVCRSFNCGMPLPDRLRTPGAQ